MKVTLYAVNTRGYHQGQSNGRPDGEPQAKDSIFPIEWHFHISLDMQVDLNHWSRRYPNGTIYQMEPPLSLGLAITLLEDIVKFHSALSSVSPTEQWINYIRSKAEGCGISPQLVEHLHFQKIKMQALIHPLTLDLQYAQSLNEHLQGRAILHEELMDLLLALNNPYSASQWRGYLQHLYLNHEIELVNAVGCKSKQKSFFFSNPAKEYTCRRCGSGRDQMYWTYCESCDKDCPYCEECLNMGRSRFCSLLIRGSSISRPHSQIMSTNEVMTHSISKWKLSKPQQEAAISGLSFLKKSNPNLESHAPFSGDADNQTSAPPCFLIWAVTGAGKTEMIFPLIESELKRGGRVLVATPRKDVVLELEPRLQKAFPNHKLAALYGGSNQRWETGDFTLATTHQLLRFWRKFDLIIIDEIDAFPFHMNPMLEFAVQKACSRSGRYILLSATPPTALQKAAKTNKLPHVKVSVRFHGYPLPVPKRKRMVTYKIKQVTNESLSNHAQSIPYTLHREIMDSLQKEAQIFLFVPQIKLIEPLLFQLRNHYENIIIDGTSSKDPDRMEKIRKFRQGHIRLLVTTTILERGVTVPKTDVLIMNADSSIYNESALIQMAGRSGRAAADPFGKVCFFAQDKTRSQVRAIQQIKNMNRLARKKGYLTTKMDIQQI